MAESPRAIFIEHVRRGELAYQVGPDGRPVFYPRVLTPADGGEPEWRVSSGRGTVYATTVVHRRGGERYNVALIDLAEGFRMMSRVEDVEPDAVRIGMAVELRIHAEPDGDPVPVFVPAGGDG